MPLQYRYNAATIPLQCRYNAATMPLPCRYNTATMPLQCSYNTAIMPLQYRQNTAKRLQCTPARAHTHTHTHTRIRRHVPSDAGRQWAADLAAKYPLRPPYLYTPMTIPPLPLLYASATTMPLQYATMSLQCRDGSGAVPQKCRHCVVYAAWARTSGGP